jgi:hypothetical protein
MGKVLDEITDREASFIASQKLFFVATAPLSSDHNVSVSPKAPGNSCIVLDPHTVAYADLTGSGAETAAHVLQNGRMTLLFCNIEKGPPKILRLSGKAELILAADVPSSLTNKFPKRVIESFGFRCIYKLRVHRISTSCGFSLPAMEFCKYRHTLEDLTSKLGQKGMFDYATKKNSYSIDGLPSLALMRQNAPSGVEPVAEEGYIYGKVVDENGLPSGESNGERETKKQLLNAQRKKGGVELSIAELGVGLAVVFVLGAIVGFFLSLQTSTPSSLLSIEL